jgi:hypothetical protein
LHGLGTITSGPQLCLQFFEDIFDLLLCLFDGYAIDSGCAAISAHEPPSMIKDITPPDLVIQ